MPRIDLQKRREYMREYRKRHPAKWSNWYQLNRNKMKDKNRASNLVQYGLTIAEYDAMLETQGGVCALCKEPPTRKRLAVDHDHITNKNRDLLCGVCNMLVGDYEKSGSLIACIPGYLARHAP